MEVFLKNLKSQSLMSRLLWPVNVISFTLIFGFSVAMALQHKKAIQEDTEAKAEAVLNLLSTVGEHLLDTHQQKYLAKFIVKSERDIPYAVYFDSNNQPLTPVPPIEITSNIVNLSRALKDHSGNYIGKIVVGYDISKVHTVFWNALALAILWGVFIQLILSIAILFVCRKVIQPLGHTLSALSKTTSILAKTSEEISGFSTSISSGVGEQSDAVQETTAAMAEISSSLKQTYSYTKESEQVMNSITVTANNGMNIMNQMVDAMTSVHHANEQLEGMVQMIKEITSKTNVINDIVFKTQILSFNAAIEAARAGQHGRGFAVVAEEVGSLSKMSGQAAKEIGAILLETELQVNEIVRNTSERVQVGRHVTEQAFRSFKDISREIDVITERIANISSASAEQESGLAKTVSGMQGINKITEINSEVAHQSNQAASILRTETLNLQKVAQSISKNIVGRTLRTHHASAVATEYKFSRTKNKNKRAS